MAHEDNEAGRDPSGVRPRAAPGKVRHTAEPTVMQRENERSRMVVDGKRIDDNTRCSLLVIHEVGGTWVLYPHGWDKFGVRLTKANAEAVAHAILASAQ